MEEEQYIKKMRHSGAHLLAAAIQKLFPDVKLAIGPAIDYGFYYDFDFGGTRISEKDFPRIEKEMLKLKREKLKFEKVEMSIKEAKKFLKESNQPYSLSLLEDIEKYGSTVKEEQIVDRRKDESEAITFYKNGSFINLCRGGHVDHFGEIGEFKIMSVAGAYFRGSEKNPMLTRIYVACFQTKEELENYINMQAEAKKRDHKKLGRELGLFVFSQNVGSGLPLFTPKGHILRETIINYLNGLKKEYGLVFVTTPHIARSELYKQSKHWQKYDAMMPPLKIEEDEYTLKPMNCPHHFEIYLSEQHSYKDLPLRLAENAVVYRFEKSGEINGLLRVRALTQDDSHWFVPHNLLGEEINKAILLIKKVYESFGLKDFYARISIRDKNNPDKYLGDDKVWQIAEKELIKAVEEQKIRYEIGGGEAAFYGPKIDFMIKDSLSREWQLTTLQLDFNQPENFDLSYIDKDGSKKRPAILHIAILGSVERFIAILLENYGGALPVWLSPVQVKVIPIAERHIDFANQFAKVIKESGVRVEIDDRTESMQKKIRDAQFAKINYMIIIGDKEIDSNTVSVRRRSGKNLNNISIESFLSEIKKEIEMKSVE